MVLLLTMIRRLEPTTTTTLPGRWFTLIALPLKILVVFLLVTLDLNILRTRNQMLERHAILGVYLQVIGILFGVYICRC